MGAGHSHDHSTAASSHKHRLAIVLTITVSILIVELIGATISKSLVLAADAGHMATDAAGIGLSLLAVWFAAKPPTSQRTFGYQRAEILAATINAVVLFGVGGFILVEATRRLLDPPEVGEGTMVIFGLIALAANAVSLFVLRHAQSESLNVRGAFLEVFSDLLGAAAVLVAAGVIALTGWERADAVASIAIGLMILPRTWSLLRSAIDVLLEATPRGVDLDDVRQHIEEVDGVQSCHDLHAWTITSGMNVLSAHVVVTTNDRDRILHELGACLAGHFDIEHSTFQLESVDHQDHEHGVCL